MPNCRAAGTRMEAATIVGLCQESDSSYCKVTGCLDLDFFPLSQKSSVR